MAEQESRVKKTLLNARVNLIFYFLTLLLSFFSRKIFLDHIGPDFVGLTGSLNNLIGFLNIVELGIGAAIGYLLYKPIYDQDHEKINDIISVMGYLYRWIGYIILTGGIIMSVFLPWIFPPEKTGFSLLLVYSAFFSFVGSTLIGYFLNYKQNLLGADQKFYIVTAYFQTANIIKTLIQMVVAYYTDNLYLWIVIEFAYSAIYSIILNWKIKQTYPWLKTRVSEGRRLLKQYPEVLKKTGQLFVHRIAYFAQYQTQPFIVYMFVNLGVVAFMGNYNLLMDKLATLISSFCGSPGAAIGNLVAEGNKEKIRNIFWQLCALEMFMASFMIYFLWHILNPFITLWIGTEYILPNVVIIFLMINFYINVTRSNVGQFINAYGLFHDMWAPIAEAIIYVVFSLAGGILGKYLSTVYPGISWHSYFPLVGVLSGGLISLISIIMIWKPYFLFSQGFKASVWKYWTGYAKYLGLSVSAIIVSSVITDSILSIDPTISILNFLIYGCGVAAIYLIIAGAIYYAMDSYSRGISKTIYNQARSIIVKYLGKFKLIKW